MIDNRPIADDDGDDPDLIQVRGGVPEQGLRTVLQQLIDWHSMSAAQYERRYGRIDPNVADSHDAAFSELLSRARAALERPRPAPPPIKMSQDTTSAERVRCGYCGQQVIPLIPHPCVALPPQTGNPEGPWRISLTRKAVPDGQWSVWRHPVTDDSGIIHPQLTVANARAAAIVRDALNRSEST